jgi:hypothetical protein
VRHKSDTKRCANCTTDCPHCGGLILIEDRKLYDFHKHLNETSGGMWPADGANTYSVAVEAKK